ncbi:MAG: TonB-dependent receptor [Pseudomonadota bacterium]
MEWKLGLRAKRAFWLAGSSIAFATMAMPAHAQSGEAREIVIEQQSLEAALAQIASEYDIDIVAPGGVTDGLVAPEIRGSLTAQQALRRLLSNSNLRFEDAQNGAFVISKTADSSAEQIVVTGQKIERSLQDTKESVTVFTEQDFNERILFDITDVFLQTPNVAGNDTGDNRFTIRGIQNAGSGIGGIGELAIVYYDNVALATLSAVSSLPRNLWDVEQVEILNGPQSTNVGRNALAGAIVIQSKKPQLDEFGAAVRGEYGNFNTYALEGMVNLPVTASSALRLTAEHSSTDGFISNATNGDDEAGFQENLILRARYLIEPTDRLSAVATFQYSENDRGNPNYLVPPGGDIESFTALNNSLSAQFFDSISGSLEVNFDLTDTWTLTSITAFLDSGNTNFFDRDEGPKELGSQVATSDATNVSQEIRAVFEGDRLRGIIGGFFIDIDGKNESTLGLPVNPANAGVPGVLLPFFPPTFIINNSGSGTFNTTNLAAFTRWEYDLTERLTITTGLRFDYEEQTNESIASTSLDVSTPLPDPVAAGMQAEMMQAGLGPVVQGGVAAVNAGLSSLLGDRQSEREADFTAFLPEFGLTYALTPDINLSAFYSRGYRTGGSQLLQDGSLNSFDPEHLDNFEVSVRSLWLDGRLRLNANAYYGLWRDQQISVPRDGNLGNLQTVNAGESRIWGFEMSGTYDPTDRTSLFASLGYSFTEFRDFCRATSQSANFPTCQTGGATGVQLRGNDFPFSPDWTAAIGGTQFLTDRFFVQGNITYQSGLVSDVENSDPLRSDGFTLFNASIGYQSDRFDLQIYGRNLANKFAVNNLFDAAFPPGSISVGPRAPREYGIVLSSRF